MQQQSQQTARHRAPYITNGGVPEPDDSKVQTARINVPALLANAAH